MDNDHLFFPTAFPYRNVRTFHPVYGWWQALLAVALHRTESSEHDQKPPIYHAKCIGLATLSLPCRKEISKKFLAQEPKNATGIFGPRNS